MLICVCVITFQESRSCSVTRCRSERSWMTRISHWRRLRTDRTQRSPASPPPHPPAALKMTGVGGASTSCLSHKTPPSSSHEIPPLPVRHCPSLTWWRSLSVWRCVTTRIEVNGKGRSFRAQVRTSTSWRRRAWRRRSRERGLDWDQTASDWSVHAPDLGITEAPPPPPPPLDLIDHWTIQMTSSWPHPLESGKGCSLRGESASRGSCVVLWVSVG